jgi:hypothetical protein
VASISELMQIDAALWDKFRIDIFRPARVEKEIVLLMDAVVALAPVVVNTRMPGLGTLDSRQPTVSIEKETTCRFSSATTTSIRPSGC